MLIIKNLKLSKPYILAPMAGVSDLPFRMLNRKFGCELAFIEMINCRSLTHKSKKTKHMLSSSQKDRPLGIQILGSDQKFIMRSLDVLADYKYDLLDFNAACPARKVVRRGEGSALLKEPKKLEKLLSALVKNSDKPVSVKIRIGWDKNSINADEVACIAEQAGVSAVFIHGRTALQGYDGDVNYPAILKAKLKTRIPIIGSGDVFSAELAKKMLAETGCDCVAVARGAIGNPWIFKEIDSSFGVSKIYKPPSPDEVCKVMLEHMKMCVDFYGERVGVVIFRKFFSCYTKGMRKVRLFRERFSRVKTLIEASLIIQEAFSPDQLRKSQRR
ncbi:MAG: tRNA dihydrouridine synthase DusB [Candidatus Omnitrophota bacterium]|jgi:tRNA-dihydrouridine synthase B|nr:MAG: tRNA dihydrouridine synthase DusB [Candidatus Omnitrophota bacterium]